jgi:hypothetical protein
MTPGGQGGPHNFVYPNFDFFCDLNAINVSVTAHATRSGQNLNIICFNNTVYQVPFPYVHVGRENSNC